MSRLFVDAVFFIAAISPADEFHQQALRIARAIKADEKVTSHPIVTELLDHFSGRGTHYRRAALDPRDEMMRDPLYTVVPETRERFDAGLALYRDRPDKGYSHTDCMSMVICAELDIKRVLTHDHHFAQEGFEVLL